MLAVHIPHWSLVRRCRLRFFLSVPLLLDTSRKTLCCFSCHLIHSTGICRMRRFLAVLRSFFQSSLLCTFSCHTSPPTISPSSLTSSCSFSYHEWKIHEPSSAYNKTLPEEEFMEVECFAHNRQLCRYIRFFLGVFLLFLPFAKSTFVSFYEWQVL